MRIGYTRLHPSDAHFRAYISRRSGSSDSLLRLYLPCPHFPARRKANISTDEDDGDASGAGG
jgi:hypothetical protein